MNQPHHAHRNHHNNHHQHSHQQQHHHPMHQQARMPANTSMPPQQQWIGPHPQPAQNSQAPQQQHHPQQTGQHHPQQQQQQQPQQQQQQQPQQPQQQQQPPPPTMPAQQQPHQQQAAQHHQQPHQQAAQHHQQPPQQHQQQHHSNQPQHQQHHHPMHTQAQMPMPPNMPPQQQWIGPHPSPAQSSQAQQQHPHHHPQQQAVQHHPQPPQQQQQQSQQAPPPPQHHITHPQAGTIMINQQTYPQNFLYQMGPPFVGPPGHLNQYEHPSAASHQSGPVNVNSQQQQVSINNHHTGNVNLPQLQPVISTPNTTNNAHHANNGPLMDHMSNRMQLNQQPYMMQNPYTHLPPYYSMMPHPMSMGAYPPGGPQIVPPNTAMIPPIRGPGDLGVPPRFDPTRTPATPLTANLSQPPSAKPLLTAPPLANMQPTSINPVAPAKPREKTKARIVDPKTKHVFTLDELTDSPKTENSTPPKDAAVPARISTTDQLISDKETSSKDEVQTTNKSAGDSSASEMVTEESRKSPETIEPELKAAEPVERRIEHPIQEVKVEITDIEEQEDEEEEIETEPVVVKICENESNKVDVRDSLAAEVANLNISKNDRPSDQAAPENSTETPVKKQTLSNLPYEADQYSPMNPEGRKKYGIKFLKAVAQEMKIDIQSSSAPNQRIDAFMPHYVNHNERGNYRNDFSSQPLTRRSSQQIISKPRKIIATHSLQQEVELNTAEKPWKPELEEEKIKVIETGEMDTKRLLKVFRGHLNKLTPQKYESLIEKIIALDLIGSERLSSVIDLVFDKAVDEPGFCELYAKMCREIATKDDEFSKHLIRKCQEEFETFDLYDGLNVDKRKLDIEQETDAIKKKIMSEELYEDMRLRRKKYLGTIKLIGEMYKFDLLSSKIIGLCMNHLIKETSNENIECLCSLLATVGPKMNSESALVRESLRTTLNVLNNIANSKKATELALENRIKFKILDTMDLSRRHWMPRTGENNPRMITEIREEERQRQQNHSGQSKSLLKSDDRDRIRGDRRPNHAYNAPLSRGKPTW